MAAPNTGVAQFNAMPILDDLPTVATQSFFNLQVTPNSTYELPVKLSNVSNETQQLTAQINNAQTGVNGIIDYSQSAAELLDPSAASLANMVVGGRQQEVALAPGEQKIVKFPIKVPVTAFKGTVLGGITVVNQPAATTKSTFGSRTQYAISVALTVADQPQPKARLTTGKVSYNRNGYQLSLRNEQPTLWHQAQATVTIHDRKRQVAEYKYNNFSIAPRSAVTVVLPHKRLPAGHYTYIFNLKAAKQMIAVKQEFTVKKQITKQVATTKVKTTAKPNWLLWSGVSVGVLVIIFGSVYWLGRKHS